MWLDWVALCTVRCPVSASTSMTLPLVSMGWFDWRWHENRSVITRSASGEDRVDVAVAVRAVVQHVAVGLLPQLLGVGAAGLGDVGDGASGA